MVSFNNHPNGDDNHHPIPQHDHDEDETEDDHDEEDCVLLVDKSHNSSNNTHNKDRFKASSASGRWMMRACVVVCSGWALLFLLVRNQTIRLSRRHPSIKIEGDDNSNSSNDNNMELEELELDWKKQYPLAQFPGLYPAPEVVLLLGPHKTGSSLIQGCVSNWIDGNDEENEENDDDETFSSDGALPLFHDWAWPLPTREAQHTASFSIPNERKGFAPLANALVAVGDTTNTTEFAMSISNPLAIIDVYRDTIQQAWQDGNKIVIGAEGFDSIVNDSVDGTKILDHLLGLLPFSDNNDDNNKNKKSKDDDDDERALQKNQVEVVITVRLPRVDHLRSIWHQLGGDAPFSDYVLHSERLYILNSLGLAHAFLQHHDDADDDDHDGVRVTLVDAQGISETPGFEICEVIACDVLQVPCINHDIETPNVKKHHSNDNAIMDLSDEQLQEVDAILNEFDCSFRNALLQQSEKLRILFPHNLFETCTADQVQGGIKPFSWVQERLRQYIKDAMGNE